MKTIITFGPMIFIRRAHQAVRSRARDLGDRLVVGVSSDELNFSKK